MQHIAESKTITEAYLRRVKADGNRVGFRYKKDGAWHDLTFREHSELTRRLACGLIHLGVHKGGRVNVVANTGIHWSLIDMAILGAGGVTVPIYPTNTPEDTKYIINHCEATVLFVDDFKNLQKIASIADGCPNLKKVIVNFDFHAKDVKAPFEVMQWDALLDLGLNHEKSLGGRVDANLSDASPSDVFTICYTSGTTGLPKGVVLPHSAMSSVMKDVEIVMRGIVTEQEILLTFLPMSHIFGKWESMTPYYLGWTNSFAESIDALVANLSEVRPTLWIAVPRIFEKVYTKISTQIDEASPAKRKLFYWALDVGREVLEAQQKGKRPSVFAAAQYEIAKKLVFSKISSKFGGRLKFCVSGSAPLAKNIQEFMHIAGVPVFEGYGLTETCAPVCVNLPGKNKFGTVGKVFPEVLIRIADDGEILIKSEKNFREYYKNPEATSEAIRDDWFYTGDIGHLDGDGYLCITDRKKDLIKTAGGKFIAPQKIENLAKSQKILSQVVLYGDQKPFAVALITLNQEYVMQFAQTHKILYSDYTELVKHADILKLVAEAVENVNGQLARYETIKKYVVLPKEFAVDDGDLTPSLKVKRKHVCGKYKDQLEALYKE